MLDQQTAVRNILIADTSLMALVPATSLFIQWPDDFSALPCIAFRESNNITTETDFGDNLPYSEVREFEFHIFHKPSTSTTAIARALDAVMTANLWNRDYSEAMVDSDTLLAHRVMRYSKRTWAL